MSQRYGAYADIGITSKHAVYVLHCFKKKSTRGAQTPKPDMDVIRARLKLADQVEKEV